MPLIVFNFQSDAGVAQTIQQTVTLNSRPPPNARFFIRQVSASSSAAFGPTMFRYVNVFIPQLMTQSGKAFFNTLEMNAANALVPVTTTRPGLRYYLSDNVSQPFAVNAFPNLSLGRHHLQEFQVTLFLTGYTLSDQIASLNAFSVVVEWDTE